MNTFNRLSLLMFLGLFFAIPANAAHEDDGQLVPAQAGPSRLEQALAQAAEIRELIDQENPGRFLIQYPEWTPLLPELLALVKEYSDSEVTFDWLSELTGGKTWMPKPLDANGRREHEVYSQICRSKTAAYDNKTVKLRKDGDIWRSGSSCKFLHAGPATNLDILIGVISMRSNIPEHNVGLCIQTDVDLITPCDGLENFLPRGKNFAHYIIRAYDKKTEEMKDDSPDQS